MVDYDSQLTLIRPVLIIEDDPDIAEVLRYALEKEALKTRVALTGEEGLYASLDRSNPPALVLLDLLLPGMKGAEIYRLIRGETITRNTPIVIISAKPIETELNLMMQLGADDYIVKPFLLREVIDKVRSLIFKAGYPAD